MIIKRINSRFSSRTIAAFALTAAILLGSFTSTFAAQTKPNTEAQAVPNVVVLVASGALPTGQDIVSFTYSTTVSDAAARADMKTLLAASGWQAKDTKVTNQQGMTAVQFMVNDAVKWERGILLVEPFVEAFKRYDLLQLNYLLSGGFRSHSLRDYSDGNVDIRLDSKANTYTYDIRIKNHSFDRLELPLVVAPPSAQQKAPVREQSRGGGSKIWLALLLAVAAGGIVFVIASRVSRK